MPERNNIISFTHFILLLLITLIINTYIFTFICSLLLKVFSNRSRWLYYVKQHLHVFIEAIEQHVDGAVALLRHSTESCSLSESSVQSHSTVRRRRAGLQDKITKNTNLIPFVGLCTTNAPIRAVTVLSPLTGAILAPSVPFFNLWSEFSPYSSHTASKNPVSVIFPALASLYNIQADVLLQNLQLIKLLLFMDSVSSLRTVFSLISQVS